MGKPSLEQRPLYVSEREFATILHALRVYQDDGVVNEAGSCDHFDDHDPLTDGEIDELCERLNGGTI